jgi:hypothetical protein
LSQRKKSVNARAPRLFNLQLRLSDSHHVATTKEARMDKPETPPNPPPILRANAPDQPSIFRPANLLREARRQLGRGVGDVPAVCLLDPDGDILDWLRGQGMAVKSPSWACYHTDLYEFAYAGQRFGIVGNVVGGRLLWWWPSRCLPQVAACW